MPALPVFAAAAAFGLAADALGARQRVSLLAFPLLGLLAWNFAVYVSLAAAPLFAGASPRAAGALARAGSGSPSGARASPRPRRRAGSRPRCGGSPRSRRARSARSSARARAALLHVGSLGFASGLVAGMYLRGLVLEYRASWESTFLDPAAVSALLRVALGPAAALLDALRGGGAARALLAPRLDRSAALARLRAGRALDPPLGADRAARRSACRARSSPRSRRAARARLARALAPPLDEPYYLRLLAADRGEGLRVHVSPYSHRPSPRAADRLLELLHELYGNRAQVTVGEPIAYGAEPGEPPPGDARVVLFNLAQPPEQEVQGAYVEAARDAGGPAAHARSLLVLLDEEPYLARLGDDGGERLAQRRRAWERMLRARRRRGGAPSRGARRGRTRARRRARGARRSRLLSTPPGAGRPDRARLRTSCSRSISHTNVGKTTLARTLLRRDVGEVLDQAHVTDATERFVLHEADGASLVLSDNPGFGDSVRLLAPAARPARSARAGSSARCGTASATARSSAASRRRATCATRPTRCSTS